MSRWFKGRKRDDAAARPDAGSSGTTGTAGGTGRQGQEAGTDGALGQTGPAPDVPMAGGGTGGPAAGDARFRPGGMDPQVAQDYADSLDTPSVGAGSEDPLARHTRLARRRRLLAVGALPALLGLVVAGWLVTVGGFTLAGNHATVRQDYADAVSRYATVERINPWLERWRVLYNLGTAEALADQPEAAVGHLEGALARVPRASMDAEGNLPEDSPECRVRTNLRAVYLVLGAAETDTQAAADYEAKAQSAAATCPVQDPQSSSTPPPTGGPSGEPSAEPTGGATGSGEPTPSGEPSGEASGEGTPTPTPAPSSSDPKEDRLRNRNGTPNETETPGNGVNGGGKRW